MKGIIFDFNGTLYWDSKLHYDAWRDFSRILRGTAFTDEEMREKMFGHTNEDIIEYAIGKKPTPEMVEKYAKEKEALYRKQCLIDRENFKLAPGAIEFYQNIDGVSSIIKSFDEIDRKMFEGDLTFTRL